MKTYGGSSPAHDHKGARRADGGAQHDPQQPPGGGTMPRIGEAAGAQRQGEPLLLLREPGPESAEDSGLSLEVPSGGLSASNVADTLISTKKQPKIDAKLQVESEFLSPGA